MRQGLKAVNDPSILILQVPSNQLNFSFQDMEDTITDVQGKLSSIIGNYNFLSEELSRIDKSICDIEHYGEFYDCSASEGYKNFKKLSLLMRERREVKNKMEIINQLLHTNVNGLAKGIVNDSINKMHNRDYTPRVEKELFERKKQHV